MNIPIGHIEVKDFEAKFVKAFCPTGPGGGVDNSCGRGTTNELFNKDSPELDALRKEAAEFPSGPRRDEALAALSPSKYDVVAITRNGDGSLSGVASFWKDADAADEDGVPGGDYIRIRNMAAAKSGGGTAIFLEVAKYAATKNAGVYLSSLEGSKGFYAKLGMHEAVGSTYFLSKDEVAAIVR